VRAVVLHDFGPADNLTYETAPDPTPGRGQVRIAVKAAGVHLIETAMREGLTIGPPLPELPAVFGSEAAGVVDSVGPGVDSAWIGSGVVTAMAEPGGYAELAVAGIEAVQPIPEPLGYEAAVAAIRTGVTAINLLDLARLRADDVVLVNSAAGGIGRLLVEYAHNLGAKVVGAAGGPTKVDVVRGLGADLAVDYNQPGWGDLVRESLGGRRVTVVLDGVGGDKAEAAFGLLADEGRFLTIGSASRQDFHPDPGLRKTRGLTVTDALAYMLAHPEDMPTREKRALAAAADGTFVPAVQTFPLSEAAAAHAALETRATSGKVVLIP
jgi:NADPH2:quinone reductase